jgi:hypothetical protein
VKRKTASKAASRCIPSSDVKPRWIRPFFLCCETSGFEKEEPIQLKENFSITLSSTYHWQKRGGRQIVSEDGVCGTAKKFDLLQWYNPLDYC